MNSLSNSLELFKEAHEHYNKKEFGKACEKITKYKKLVEYELLSHSDKRNGKAVSISIIIVSFGANEALLDCLDSLKIKNDKDFEIILVDNGSNEKIIQLLNDYPILHISPPINLLPSEGRNVGAYFARGKYLVFLDDDALVHRDYIKSIKAAWNSFDFLAIRGRILQKTKSGNNSFMGHYDFGKYPMPAVLMTEGNMAIRRDMFLQVGGFDPLIFGGEGTELTYRCKKYLPEQDIYYWPEMVIYHDFVRGANLTAKKKRHAIAAAYFNYIAPEITTLAESYFRWYKSRPMGAVVYDSRNLLRKISSYTQEKFIALKNLF